MEQPHQSLLGRLGDDFRRNPGVWIGVGIAVLILIVGVLAYQNSQSGASSGASTSSGTNVPANGYGQPVWGSAGGTGQDPAGDLLALLQYLNSQQTPNPPATAAPPPATAPPPIPPKGPPAPQMTPPPTTPGQVWGRTHPGGVSSSGGPYVAPGVRQAG